MSTFRPADPGAERYLIAAVNNGRFDLTKSLGVVPWDFEDTDRRRVYFAAETLDSKGVAVSFVSIASELSRDPRDVLALGSEEGAVPIEAVVENCAEKVRECYINRRSSQIGKQLEAGDISHSEAVTELQKVERAALHDAGPSFADFESIFDGGLETERPSIATVLPGLPILYAGRINETHGEPSTGKTNIAAALSLVTMKAKGTVLFLDPEDNPTGIARRMKSFGGTKEMLVQRFRYVHNPEPADFPALIAWAQKTKPALVVLDGVAEALAAEGLDENSAADILQFFRTRIRPFADAGAAVLLSDHVSKSQEGRGRWARGSGAKLGRYDGACLEVKLVTPYSPGVAGSVRLVVAKDRCGGLGPVGAPVVDIHFEPGESGTDIDFRKPSSGDNFMPTAIMEKVSRRLEEDPPASKRALRALGKTQYVDLALSKLEALGYLKVTVQGAPKPTLFELIKPYREGAQ